MLAFKFEFFHHDLLFLEALQVNLILCLLQIFSPLFDDIVHDFCLLAAVLLVWAKVANNVVSHPWWLDYLRICAHEASTWHFGHHREVLSQVRASLDFGLSQVESLNGGSRTLRHILFVIIRLSPHRSLRQVSWLERSKLVSFFSRVTCILSLERLVLPRVVHSTNGLTKHLLWVPHILLWVASGNYIILFELTVICVFKQLAGHHVKLVMQDRWSVIALLGLEGKLVQIAWLLAFFLHCQ